MATAGHLAQDPSGTGQLDSRGVVRGRCTFRECLCKCYDGGKAGMKCVNCQHPPVKHLKCKLVGDLLETLGAKSCTPMCA